MTSTHLHKRSEHMTISTSEKLLQISYGGHTSAGVKAINEDAFAAHLPDKHARTIKGAVACVADGVSCSDNARQASQTSVTTFIQDYLSTPETWDIKTASSRVLSSLNSWLFNQGQSTLSRQNGLVTTFSAIIIKSTSVHLLHCGDSRIYRYRNNKLLQLSHDHTLHGKDNSEVLVRALGMDSDLKVDYQQRSACLEDIFVLTSDGVHGVLTEEELGAHLTALVNSNVMAFKEGPNAALEKASKAMIAQALGKGSTDNLTCLLVKVQSLPTEDLNEALNKLTSLVIPPALKPGVKLDEYKITRILYSGPRSHIYLAEHPRFRNPFVLKVPSEQFAEDPEYLDGFVREQWIGRKIDNPGIMKIYDPLPKSKFLYHTCEYIEGQTLRQWMHDNPEPDLNKVRDLSKMITACLRVFQRQGMLHRDLKPENIMLTNEGQIKLIDFGTVHVNGLNDVSSPLSQETPAGTVDYIAPEYLLGQKGAHRSDIFSLGVIVYEMLTRHIPYKSVSPYKHRISSYSLWSYQSALESRKEIPVWVDLALKKACAPNPTQRYSSLSEFMTDLETPNKDLLASYDSAPLIEKNPILVWQCVSALLLLIIILQWLGLDN